MSEHNLQTTVCHLRYSMYDAPKEHPQTVMKMLGISYAIATPQSIADQWWFWCCDNVPPGTLPPYLSRLDLDPQEQIGWGLSKEEADMISAWNAKVQLA